MHPNSNACSTTHRPENGIPDVETRSSSTLQLQAIRGITRHCTRVAKPVFRVGGKWRANYTNAGSLGDETTIENTILCYDPKRMFSIKPTGFPRGFEFVAAAKETWSVFYFTKISDSKTKIAIVGLGYTDSEQSMKMREFFKPANQYAVDQLKAALETKMPQENDN